MPPASGRVTYSFNPDWKFIKQDAPGIEGMSFDDKKWNTVSTSHIWNDVDSFDEYISRASKETLYMEPAWYRKHFNLPASANSQRVAAHPAEALSDALASERPRYDGGSV